MQEEWIADWIAENDKADEYDPDVVWFPHRLVNLKREAEAWAAWEYNRKHEKKRFRNADFTEWSSVRDDEHPHDMWDGVMYIVTQEKPESDEWF